MSWTEIILLISSGILVGFINTLAGGGTIISLSILMFLGLPGNVANGTNRIAVLIQTLASSVSFRHQHVLDTRKGLILSIPVVIGSILGAMIAVDLNDEIIEKAFAVVMIFMLFFIIYKPQRWLQGKEELTKKPISFWQLLIFFIIGLYGGFIHVGIGYFLLASLVLGTGYDLVKANALKVFIVLLYVPFTLLVFIYDKQVNYAYGLVHAIGNVIGALVAARFAVTWGANFVRWVMVVIVLVTSLHLLDVVNVKEIFSFLVLKQ